MNTEPVPFVPEAPVPQAANLKVAFRAEWPGDRNYILGCWDQGWRRSMDCRRMNERRFRHTFQDLVVGGYGVLQAPDTKVLVGCSPEDGEWIWCFCVFTPGEGRREPVIHWMNVRPTLRGDGGTKRSIRRHRLATLMLVMGKGETCEGPGVKDRLTYTCRPGLSEHAVRGDATDEERETLEVRMLETLEADLVEAGRRIGVVASHYPLERWLRGGR